MALPVGGHVGHGDAGQGLGCGLGPVGVAAIHGGGKTAGGDGGGLGAGVGPGGGHALALALPDGGGVPAVKTRGGQLACGQGQGGGQHVVGREGAQGGPQLVGPGRHGPLGAQVHPALGELVLVQCGFGGRGGQAALGHEGGGRRQPGLRRWVAAAAAVEGDAHVEHGDGRGRHQGHAGSAGQLPHIYHRGGLGAQRQKKRNKNGSGA